MEAETDYWLIWLLYMGASLVFYPIFWRYTAFHRALWLSCSLRALMAALILTPWYANTQGEALAPALMVATLDAITIGTEAATRAAVPLVLGLILAEIVATVWWVVLRKKQSR